MSCDQIQDSLVDYLLNELNDSQQANVEQHLAGGCESCCAELAGLSESMDLLWQSVPSAPLPHLLREQVLATCLNTAPSACQQKSWHAPSTLASRWPTRFVSEMLLAFAAGVLLMYAVHLLTQQRAAPAVARAMNTNMQPLATGRLGTGDTPAALALSGRPYKKSHFVALHRQAKANDLSGQLLWDRLSREIHIYCFGLSTPPDGRKYTVWMIGPQKTVRIVDELTVDAAGEGRAVAPWPVGEFQYVQVALSRKGTDHLNADEVALTSDAIPAND